MKTKRDAQQSYQIPTVTELAFCLGRHRGTVCRWLARDDWPFSRVPPWAATDFWRMLEWAAELRPSGRGEL